MKFLFISQNVLQMCSRGHQLQQSNTGQSIEIELNKDIFNPIQVLKIITMDFRQFSPIFRRPQRQNESFGRILQKTNILDLNLGSIHKKSRACSPNGSGDMTISAGNSFYTIKLRNKIKLQIQMVITWKYSKHILPPIFGGQFGNMHGWNAQQRYEKNKYKYLNFFQAGYVVVQ